MSLFKKANLFKATVHINYLNTSKQISNAYAFVNINEEDSWINIDSNFISCNQNSLIKIKTSKHEYFLFVPSALIYVDQENNIYINMVSKPVWFIADKRHKEVLTNKRNEEIKQVMEQLDMIAAKLDYEFSFDNVYEYERTLNLLYEAKLKNVLYLTEGELEHEKN